MFPVYLAEVPPPPHTFKSVCEAEFPVVLLYEDTRKLLNGLEIRLQSSQRGLTSESCTVLK